MTSAKKGEKTLVDRIYENTKFNFIAGELRTKELIQLTINETLADVEKEIAALDLLILALKESSDRSYYNEVDATDLDYIIDYHKEILDKLAKNGVDGVQPKVLVPSPAITAPNTSPKIGAKGRCRLSASQVALPDAPLCKKCGKKLTEKQVATGIHWCNPKPKAEVKKE